MWSFRYDKLLIPTSVVLWKMKYWRYGSYSDLTSLATFLKVTERTTEKSKWKKFSIDYKVEPSQRWFCFHPSLLKAKFNLLKRNWHITEVNFKNWNQSFNNCSCISVINTFKNSTILKTLHCPTVKLEVLRSE